MAKISTRERIVGEADRLFYEQGYEHTSFTDIANAVNISRGNFYYHFKTKDEILDAVIRFRITKTETMLNTWEMEAESPLERIRSFIRILVTNQNKIIEYGCPVGTLSSELTKLNHAYQKDANTLFDLFRIWLGKQFQLLGREQEADALALHLLVFSQGVATLASAFHDKALIHQEVTLIDHWLDNYLEKTPSD